MCEPKKKIQYCNVSLMRLLCCFLAIFGLESLEPIFGSTLLGREFSSVDEKKNSAREVHRWPNNRLTFGRDIELSNLDCLH